MPKLGDFSGVWNTIRELNVAEIREEAEQPITLVLIGEAGVRAPVARALQGAAGGRPRGASAADRDALVQYNLPIGREQEASLGQAALVMLAVDGKLPPPPDLQSSLDKLSTLATPALVVCLGAPRLPAAPDGRTPEPHATQVVFIAGPAGKALEDALAVEIVEQLPDEQRVAAARRLPGLREAVARDLIATTSFSNATYALTSALPELIPVLNLPLNAADLLVLTKNQALMVYRLGLAFGAPGDFQAQMREILPVIGSGFMWRQMARQLVGLVPGFGLIPKVAVAYGGTYAAGNAALVWYSRGEVLSKGALRRLYRQAILIGRQRASELVARRRRVAPEADPSTRETRRLPASRRGLRRFLPGRGAPPAPPENRVP